jgi:acetyltransferase-like isoleucine patch superfamily enzyme
MNLDDGSVFQKTIFVIRYRYFNKIKYLLKKKYFQCLGMRIGNNTFFSKFYVTWPHKISLGNDCNLEHDIYFKHDGIWSAEYSIVIDNNVFIGTGCEFNIRKRISIGKNSLIASGCRFIDHDHGIALGELIGRQDGPEAEIIIGEDVWIGCNVIILKGVTIADGAVVAAGAIVTKSIPKNEIWAGVPAKKIGERK